MRFSVIIPTFKRAQLLGDAIRAALAQTHTNREILIVDDGSPDDTRNVASTFGDAVRYFRQKNKGKSAALNLGISASTGDAIIVLDDDDLFPPRTIAKHAEALERNAAADFFFGRRRLLVVNVGIAAEDVGRITKPRLRFAYPKRKYTRRLLPTSRDPCSLSKVPLTTV